MNLRKLGNTGRMVSEVGLGCWQLGADWGTVDDFTAQKTLEAALENGVTFFDTADVYGLGRSVLAHLNYDFRKPSHHFQQKCAQQHRRYLSDEDMGALDPMQILLAQLWKRGPYGPLPKNGLETLVFGSF